MAALTVRSYRDERSNTKSLSVLFLRVVDVSVVDGYFCKTL